MLFRTERTRRGLIPCLILSRSSAVGHSVKVSIFLSLRQQRHHFHDVPLVQTISRVALPEETSRYVTTRKMIMRLIINRGFRDFAGITESSKYPGHRLTAS